MTDNVVRRWKGVFIPKCIWLDDKLTWMEKCFLAEIDSLSTSTETCFASPKHFAQMFDVSILRVSNIFSDLKKRGFVKGSFRRGEGVQLVNYFTESVNSVHETREVEFTESVKSPGAAYKGIEITTKKTIERKRASAPVVVISSVHEFCEKWQGAHNEAFGNKGVLAAKRSVATLLACGLPPDALLDVARKAWANSDAKAFWLPKARDMKTFCEKFELIQAELAKPNGAPKVESHQMQEDIKVRVHRTGPNGESVVSYE